MRMHIFLILLTLKMSYAQNEALYSYTNNKISQQNETEEPDGSNKARPGRALKMFLANPIGRRARGRRAPKQFMRNVRRVNDEWRQDFMDPYVGRRIRWFTTTLTTELQETEQPGEKDYMQSSIGGPFNDGMERRYDENTRIMPSIKSNVEQTTMIPDNTNYEQPDDQYSTRKARNMIRRPIIMKMSAPFKYIKSVVTIPDHGTSMPELNNYAGRLSYQTTDSYEGYVTESSNRLLMRAYSKDQTTDSYEGYVTESNNRLLMRAYSKDQTTDSYEGYVTESSNRLLMRAYSIDQRNIGRQLSELNDPKKMRIFSDLMNTLLPMLVQELKNLFKVNKKTCNEQRPGEQTTTLIPLSYTDDEGMTPSTDDYVKQSTMNLMMRAGNENQRELKSLLSEFTDPNKFGIFFDLMNILIPILIRELKNWFMNYTITKMDPIPGEQMTTLMPALYTEGEVTSLNTDDYEKQSTMRLMMRASNEEQTKLMNKMKEILRFVNSPDGRIVSDILDILFSILIRELKNLFKVKEETWKTKNPGEQMKTRIATTYMDDGTMTLSTDNYEKQSTMRLLMRVGDENQSKLNTLMTKFTDPNKIGIFSDIMNILLPILVRELKNLIKSIKQPCKGPSPGEQMKTTMASRDGRKRNLPYPLVFRILKIKQTEVYDGKTVLFYPTEISDGYDTDSKLCKSGRAIDSQTRFKESRQTTDTHFPTVVYPDYGIQGPSTKQDCLTKPSKNSDKNDAKLTVNPSSPTDDSGYDNKEPGYDSSENIGEGTETTTNDYISPAKGFPGDDDGEKKGKQENEPAETESTGNDETSTHGSPGDDEEKRVKQASEPAETESTGNDETSTDGSPVDDGKKKGKQTSEPAETESTGNDETSTDGSPVDDGKKKVKQASEPAEKESTGNDETSTDGPPGDEDKEQKDKQVGEPAKTESTNNNASLSKGSPGDKDKEQKGKQAGESAETESINNQASSTKGSPGDEGSGSGAGAS